MKTGTKYAALLVLLNIVAAPWWAFVAATLWQWFVVPLGVPTVSRAHVFGLWSLVALFKTHSLPNENDGHTEAERTVQRVLDLFLTPLLLLGLGAIARSLIHGAP